MEPGISVGMSGADEGIAPRERSQSGDFKGAPGSRYELLRTVFRETP